MPNPASSIIDTAAECLLAVTGVTQTEPVSRQQGREAEAIPRVWTALIREWFDRSRAARFSRGPSPDWRRTLDDLTAGIPQARAADLVSGLASDDLSLAYQHALSAAREYLRARWPALSRETPTGPEYLEPGYVVYREACAVYAVVDHPERVLDEMAMETLQASQVEAFKAVYPGLYNLVLEAVQGELIRRVARTKSYSVPWRQERVLRALLQLPANAQMAQVRQQPEQGTGSSGGSAPSQFGIAFQTRGQRAANK